jgi:gliding motility-associated-like protein
MRRHLPLLAALLFLSNSLFAQNSMVGDGFGGRGWYVSHNYQVGSYSAYTVCGNNNQLFGWGNNSQGELGNGLLASTVLPVATIGMSNVKFYTSGYISGAIKTDNTAWIWGPDYGNPSNYLTSTPRMVLSNVNFMDAGASHVVFVKQDSTVWGAGLNMIGALGSGTMADTFRVPVQMIGITNAVRAIALRLTTVILLRDGTVKICGGGGIMQQNNSLVPVTVPGLNNIVDIKGNAFGAFALDSSGDVFAFGADYPHLGLGTTSFPTIVPPTKINFPAGAAPIIALSANDDGGIGMALDSNRNAYGWGENGFGQLGIGNNDGSSPVLLASNVIDIFAGETFSYILKSDNTLWATGESLNNNTGGSIWMNLPNIHRNVFTQINPTIAPMNLCEIIPSGINCSRNVNLGVDTTLCEGEKLMLTTGIEGFNFQWQDNSTNPHYIVDSPGTYWVTASNYHCVSTDTIKVYYTQLPKLNLGNDTVLCKTEKLTLNLSNPNATYLWQDNSTNSSYTVVKTGIYWVNASQNGCKNTDTIVITFKDCNCILNAPNAITPNGDGINDKWIIPTSNCFQQMDVSVYNRYGSLVYKKNNYQNDWEGTFKLKPLPDATYYYVIKAIGFNHEEQILKGNLTIIR